MAPDTHTERGYSQLLSRQSVLTLPNAPEAVPLKVCTDILVAKASCHQLQEGQQPAA